MICKRVTRGRYLHFQTPKYTLFSVDKALKEQYADVPCNVPNAVIHGVRSLVFPMLAECSVLGVVPQNAALDVSGRGLNTACNVPY